MTANELRSHLNRVFGIEHPWPKTYEVDAETYENCLTVIEDWADENGICLYDPSKKKLMFKGVELKCSTTMTKSNT